MATRRLTVIGVACMSHLLESHLGAGHSPHLLSATHQLRDKPELSFILGRKHWANASSAF